MELEILLEVILPICICVVLPVSIVWICAAYRRKNVNRKAEVMMKALEAGIPCDVDTFLYDKKEQKRREESAKSVKVKLHDRIQSGFTLLAVGGAFLVWYLIDRSNFELFVGALLALLGAGFTASGFIGRKMFADEIAAETKSKVEKIAEGESK